MTTPLALPMHLFSLTFTRGRICEIESEIAALKSSIEKLRLERKILKSHLATYIYPVLTLPHEIVSEIFLQSLDPDATPGSPTSPLFLGHICQKWRHIALSTPWLWTSISLTITHFSHTRLQLLDTWLTRSRECPLSITITDYRRAPGVSVIREYIDAILPHQRRWQALVLKIHLADFPQIQGELPSLRDLHIWPSHSSSPAADWPLIAPKLKAMTLSGITPTITPDKFQLPWKQLTSLCVLKGGSPADVVYILRSAVNLGCLTAQMTDLDGSERIISPIQHHHLRSFSLLRWASPLPLPQRQLLDLLTLPVLDFIEVSESILPTVTDLIARSQCPLNNLTVIAENTEYIASLTPEGKVLLEVDEDETNGSSE
ncbi:hypothetical protein B0H13DRAFT_1717854 [Mycena leptocephala]|nr:hypothetical protein B0H13DRAFT_1717854 [Mycena leptocephala]